METKVDIINEYKILVEIFEEKKHLPELGMNGRILLKCIL
jgi:hypothetical protein